MKAHVKPIIDSSLLQRVEELNNLRSRLREKYSRTNLLLTSVYVLLSRILRKYSTYNSSKKMVEFGDFTYGYPTIHTWGEGARLKIGRFCSIADNVQIFLGGNHRADWVTTYPFNAFLPAFSYINGHPATNGNIIIGNDVWLGADSKIMSGVTIADGAVVAANALVSRDINAYEIYGGVPAKFIKKRFSDEIIEKLLEIQWWNWSATDIAAAVPLLQSTDFEKLFKYHEEHIAGE